MIEVRYTPSEVRMVTDKSNTIEGHGALYNVVSVPELGFDERIMAGAFQNADLSDVRMLWNHNGDKILARTKSGTLEVGADSVGLFYRGEVAETSWGKDALISVARGDVDQSSFAFGQLDKGDDEWGVDERGNIFRNINRFRKITDVSPTAFPAYPQTKIDARALSEIRSMLQKPKTDMARIDLMIKIHKIITQH
jgi:HK97 family phage prohead protease